MNTEKKELTDNRLDRNGFSACFLVASLDPDALMPSVNTPKSLEIKPRVKRKYKK